MKRLSAIPLLAETAAAQWGMFTTGQAERLGISRLQVARLNKTGAIERVAHGVYRESAVPEHELDQLRFTWMSLDQGRFNEERLHKPNQDFVISGLSAAQVHGIGDWYVDSYDFSHFERKQTQRNGVKFKFRDLNPSSVTVVGGLPTTTIEQTLADLLAWREDFSNVAGAFAQVVREGKIFESQLESLLNPLAHRLGFKEGDGRSVLFALQESAYVDQVSLAKQIATIAPTIATASALFATIPTDNVKVTIGDLTEALNHIGHQGITQMAQLTELLRSAEQFGKPWEELVEQLK